MKIKVSNTTPLQIDWLVAKIRGLTSISGKTDVEIFTTCRALHCYTTDWGRGGPILSQARISRTIDHSGLWIAYWTDGYTEGDEGLKWMHCDRSELVAGLRCYVESELGCKEVEIPEELCLRPCRSPYCECNVSECTHPGCYDARGTPISQDVKPTMRDEHNTMLQKEAPKVAQPLGGNVAEPAAIQVGIDGHKVDFTSHDNGWSAYT